MRAILIVLDGIGVGRLSDASHYRGINPNTLSHSIGNRLDALPFLSKFGFSYFLNRNNYFGEKVLVGKLRPITKDNDSGPIHWEMMGIKRKGRLPLYPKGVPNGIVRDLEKRTGYKFIGNVMVKEGRILKKLRIQHESNAHPILYTTTDSVIQVAAMKKHVPIKDLYVICETLRELLPAAGRIIAKPFILNKDKEYERDSKNRKDYMLNPPHRKFLLPKLQEKKIPTIGIGKIGDFFQGIGISRGIKTGSNLEGIEATISTLQSLKKGLIFTNLVDFDMMGHSNNKEGMFDLLRQFDRKLPSIIKRMNEDDLLILTSDHGCDPTQSTKTHTREYGLLVCYQKKLKEYRDMGSELFFVDIATTLADYFNVDFKPGNLFYKFSNN